MTALLTLQDRINGAYPGLSDKLKVAAKYVANNPLDIATRSLRSVAQTSGVSPATFSRLARALGYKDYEQMREEGRIAVGKKLSPFSERASALRRKASVQDGRAILRHQSAACIANIEQLDATIDEDTLNDAVSLLHAAQSVLVVGSMGSSGITDYFGYLGQWFNANWKIAGRNGIELSASLSRLRTGDVVIGLSKAPYARRTVTALKAAREKGAKTIAITDSTTSPSLQFADRSFIVASDSPQFFSSYAATLVLMETLISMLLARAGPEAETMIKSAETQIAEMGENWVM